MSMSVVGIKPADEKWHAMKAIYENCRKAGVAVPREVEKFFDDASPDEAGVVADLIYGKHKSAAVSKWQDDSRDGFEVDLSKLDKDIKVLRFYCSW